MLGSGLSSPQTEVPVEPVVLVITRSPEFDAPQFILRGVSITLFRQSQFPPYQPADQFGDIFG
jgi:hypothetical protein